MAEEKLTPSSAKLKALQDAMDKIDKRYGKGAIMRLGDDKVEDVPVIPTGSVALNMALGVGGYPKGRIIEIYGPESSGKTTLASALAKVTGLDFKRAQFTPDVMASDITGFNIYNRTRESFEFQN